MFQSLNQITDKEVDDLKNAVNKAVRENKARVDVEKQVKMQLYFFYAILDS